MPADRRSNPPLHPVSVRLPEPLRKRLQAVAKALGIKAGVVVRLCVQMQIERLEQTGRFDIPSGKSAGGRKTASNVSTYTFCKALSVRFPAELRERILSTAAAIGVKPADVVRLCVQMQIENVAKTGRFEVR